MDLVSKLAPGARRVAQQRMRFAVDSVVSHVHPRK